MIFLHFPTIVNDFSLLVVISSLTRTYIPCAFVRACDLCADVAFYFVHLLFDIDLGLQSQEERAAATTAEYDEEDADQAGEMSVDEALRM